MVRLESLPDEEQPLRDTDVVSWQLGQGKPARSWLRSGQVTMPQAQGRRRSAR